MLYKIYKKTIIEDNYINMITYNLLRDLIFTKLFLEGDLCRLGYVFLGDYITIKTLALDYYYF